jgi:hypothetical protein
MIMKNIGNKKLLTTILVAIAVTIASTGCSGSGEDADTPKTKETLTIKCPNPDCEYTRPGDPESLSVVDTCPKCFGKLKP